MTVTSGLYLTVTVDIDTRQQSQALEAWGGDVFKKGLCLIIRFKIFLC